MGIISIAVSHLVKAGVTGDALVDAIAELEQEIQQNSATSIEKRRASDAERKRRSRENKSGHVTSRDTCDTLDKVSPQTPLQIKPKSNPPISPQTEVDLAVEIWNDAAERAGLPKVAKVTRRRSSAISARIGEFGIDAWRSAVSAVEKSAFHCGKNERGWKADIDFVASENKFVSLIERKASGPARQELEMPIC
jgi:hypothetical protein